MSRGIEQQAERDQQRQFMQKSALEQTTQVSLHGAPQLRRAERSQLLGQFMENVLKAAPAAVLDGKSVHPELARSINDERAERLFIKAPLLLLARPYLKLAKTRGIPVTVVHSPEFKADTALVVTTREQVAAENIWIEDPRS